MQVPILEDFKMLGRTRLKVHTFKVIVITSLVWFLLDAIVLMYYTDCLGRGWNCGGEESRPNRDRLITHHKGKHPSGDDSEISGLDYPINKLHRWQPPSAIVTSQGVHGENGQGVKIPPEMEKEAKDRFTENQFNLVASEMISLNRSLSDYRLEG